ncbi:MAG TPA: glycoside hydrolase family 2 protein, partial [Chloroflexota bacterium]
MSKTMATTLDSGWHVRQASPSDFNPSLDLPPLPAQVPGHIHLDLQRAGVIPDPFYRLQERDVAWVDDVDWTYETTFDLKSVTNGDLYLRFLGLDTVAEICLNGRRLATTDNMFIPHEFDIRPFIRQGENSLAVTFRSARRVGRERLEAWSARHPALRVHHSMWDARSFVRKAQYMFGWDWGPILLSCGIWRPVELLAVPVARITDWHYEAVLESDGATVRIETEIERATGRLDEPLTLLAQGEGMSSASVMIPTGNTRTTMSLTLNVPGARRWSPDDPHLYPVRLTMQSDETIVDERAVRVGLRTIELVRPPDRDGQGEGFVIRVNGENHFCKGANWIPADSFPSKTYDNEASLRPLLSAAREAGCTMLRVWGGGMYESETFYALCDELGLLVWQDFPYACAYYPDDSEALDVAAAEAMSEVRRIRVHPSLALWCGNNENHQMYADNWQGLNPPSFLGESIYETVLPDVVATHDPATPYWPSSAYGGQNPNSPDVGDRHNWNVWHGEGIEGGDWPQYAEDRARFC